jgi:peroxiredoxin Q/BCP
MKINDKAPNTITINQDENEFFLKDYMSDNNNFMVLYFYPKDDTKGCTIEANDFNDNLNKFENLQTTIVGVSPDDSKKHCKFINKYHLNFNLICDTNLELCNIFKVWRLKKFMGKEYMGVIRSTFILDKDLNVLAVFDGVRVKNHIENVLSELNKIMQKEKE